MRTYATTRQRDALQSEMGEVRERAQLAETNANLAASQRDAMEAELKKKEEEEAQEKKAQLNQHGADLAELPDSAARYSVPGSTAGRPTRARGMPNLPKRCHQIQVRMQSPRP